MNFFIRQTGRMVEHSVKSHIDRCDNFSHLFCLFSSDNSYKIMMNYTETIDMFRHGFEFFSLTKLRCFPR